MKADLFALFFISFYGLLVLACILSLFVKIRRNIREKKEYQNKKSKFKIIRNDDL